MKHTLSSYIYLFLFGVASGFSPIKPVVPGSLRIELNAYRQQTEQVQLPQVSAEVMTCIPNGASVNKSNPPLIFIHGSFHASWCWAEEYMPFFAELGYPCYALSLRGTGGTFAGEGVKKVKIDEHVHDVTDFIQHVISEGGNQLKPVILSHSFGGLAVMKYLEKNLFGTSSNPVEIPLSGVVMMCSVPPSGNGRMTQRFLFRSLKDSWKITAGLALKKGITNPTLCRELFFDSSRDDNGISDEDIDRFRGYFKRDTVATIDLVDLAKQLPSTYVDEQQRALFCDLIPNALVIGAEDDFIVDREGVEETAKYFGVDPIFVDSPHDIMLGRRWKNGAQTIVEWLETITS